MFMAIREAKARMQIGPMLDQSKFLLLHNGIHLTSAEWDDPYLYGYFGGATTTLLKFGSSGKIDGESIAMVQCWGWERLSALPGQLYLSRFNSFQTSRNTEWSEGYDKGMLWALLLVGKAKADHPAVNEAIEAGRLFGKQFSDYSGHATNEMQDAAAIVFTRDWYNYIADRKSEAA